MKRFHDEHIVPLALNGALILSEASCQQCERIINREIENCLLTEEYARFRAKYGLPTRRPRNRKKTVKLPSITGGWIKVPATEYTAPVPLYRFKMARILSGVPPIPNSHAWTMDILGGGDKVLCYQTNPDPCNNAHFYQKHMTQHMVSGINRDWMSEFTNVFLIRHPARVAASRSAIYDNPTLDDIGFVQQAELYDLVKSQGGRPVVIDSFAIRQNPENALKRLCLDIGLTWDPAMLHWPAGGHPADGIWARHWYGAVHKSTEFAGAEGPLPKLDSAGKALVEQAMPYYTAMHRIKL